MRLPPSAHTSRPWRIHEVAPDFRLEDLWALPTPGGPEDLHILVEAMSSGDPGDDPSPVVRGVWALRWTLGRLLGWDEPGTGLGARVTSLRERLPSDLRDGPRGPAFASAPFESLYLTDDEWAAEVANETVHGVMHIGWVPDGSGGYRAQMAVLVKPNGLLGRAYMAAIRPFRYALIYPALLRRVDREWRARTAGRAPA